MVKLKTIPNMGTRKLTMPFIGEVEFVNGVFECPKEHLSDLMTANCGFKILHLDGKVAETEKDSEPETLPEGSSGDSVTITKETLEAMRVKDLEEIFDQIKENLNPEQIEEYPKMKKPERVNFLFEILNK